MEAPPQSSSHATSQQRNASQTRAGHILSPHVIIVTLQVFMSLVLSQFLVPDYIAAYIDFSDFTTASVWLSLALILQTVIFHDLAATVVMAIGTAFVVMMPRFVVFCFVFTALEVVAVPTAMTLDEKIYGNDAEGDVMAQDQSED